jgi:AcrR family transcriptional regulator
MSTLIEEGVDQVKVLTLANKLDCARSSFYWYFKDRNELLKDLLGHWRRTNTRALVEAAQEPAETVGYALGNLFVAWADPGRYDTRLDFAIREWSRRSKSVRDILSANEDARLKAIIEMFLRYDYPPSEADVRARIVYFTLIGYATTEQSETWATRVARGRDYLFCHTGRMPTDDEVSSLSRQVLTNTKVRRPRIKPVKRQDKCQQESADLIDPKEDLQRNTLP